MYLEFSIHSTKKAGMLHISTKNEYSDLNLTYFGDINLNWVLNNTSLKGNS